MNDEPRDLKLTDRMIPMKGGKEYLQVADRIVWFRRDYPEGTIETTIVSIDEERGSAIFRARVTTGQGGVAEATGDETLRDFPAGWIGKAETKAVGRALGYLGYGTASAGFEEGARVVDAPQDRRPAKAPESAQNAPGRAEAPAPAPAPTPPRTVADWPDEELLAVVRDDTRDPARRVAAARIYAARALDPRALNARMVALAALPDADREKIRAGLLARFALASVAG